MDNFHPLEVVGRGSETQLEVGKTLNYELSAFRVNRKISEIQFLTL